MATGKKRSRVTVYELTMNDLAFVTLCAAGTPYWNTADAYRIAYPTSKAAETSIKRIAYNKIREPAMVEKYNEILALMTNGLVSAPRVAPVLPKTEGEASKIAKTGDDAEKTLETMLVDGEDGGKDEIKRLAWITINNPRTSEESRLKYMKLVSDIDNMKKLDTAPDEKKQTMYYLPLRCESCSLFRNSQANGCKNCKLLKHINALPEHDKSEILADFKGREDDVI